jgi:hypothetical protein
MWGIMPLHRLRKNYVPPPRNGLLLKESYLYMLFPFKLLCNDLIFLKRTDVSFGPAKSLVMHVSKKEGKKKNR